MRGILKCIPLKAGDRRACDTSRAVRRVPSVLIRSMDFNAIYPRPYKQKTSRCSGNKSNKKIAI